MAVATNPAQKLILTETKQRSEFAQAWSRFRANQLAMIGLVIIVMLCLMAIFAEPLAPYDPLRSEGTQNAPPTAGHILGLDNVGRDLLSRVIFGSRVALIVGMTATLVSVIIGVAVGAVSGYFGGWVDTILSRITDTLMAFPILALLIVLAAVLESSLRTTVLVLGTTVWARYARVVRADVLSVREQEFVTAAQASGVRSARIILRHIIPNVLGPVIVLASLGVGSIIILEAALSFLGLGVPPPTPSWGDTLAGARQSIIRYPRIAFYPGMMIMLTVLAFNFVGDGLRDALDPRERAD